MDRPYISTYLPKLKEVARENWHSLFELERILSEIELRGNREANLIFECELGEQIERLKTQESEKELQKKKQSQQEGYFQWPTTSAPASKHGYSVEAYWYKDGLLSYVGYKVGHNGEITTTRKQILDSVFHNELPRVDSIEYMDEWGERQTPQRLEKMAKAIAAFVRNAKRRRDADMSEAVRNWEEDLRYLYDKYYIGRFGFYWPKTEDGE